MRYESFQWADRDTGVCDSESVRTDPMRGKRSMKCKVIIAISRVRMAHECENAQATRRLSDRSTAAPASNKVALM